MSVIMLEVDKLAPKLRDHVLEREIASELEKISERERLEFILKLSEQPRNGCFAASLALLKRTIHAKELLTEAFVIGLRTSDSSTVKYWVECVIDKLGLRRTAQILEQEAMSNPTIARKVVYHLPKWYASHCEEQQAFVQRMRQIANNSPGE
jgi:hypothetical protein